MPEFVKPFSGTVPRKITKDELIRAIRLNISAEYEAVHLYMAHADATEDLFARQVLTEIANEERVHIGEFMELLRRLDPEEARFLEEGRAEVEQIAQGADAAAAGGDGMTVGNLRSEQS
jgi:rubrerythrin